MPRIETRTLQSVTLSDVQQIQVQRTAAGGLQVAAFYEIRDGAGNIVYRNSIGDVGLSPAARSALATWITNNVLPIVNTEEVL
jgi:uncharacterized membrane protein